MAIRDAIGCASFVLMLAEAAWCGEPLAGQARAMPPAAVEGRMTVVETVNRTVTTQPLRNLTVYLLTLDQSQPLLELQRRCRKSMARTGAARAFAAYNVCTQCLAEAVELVPRLPSTAATKTDGEGFYKFEGVPPARRYQVVAVKVEDDEPIVITGLTPKLGPQQRATLNLSENDPWTAADPLLNYK